eukprot:scaffold1291_cov33-Phaeocystis_antarctica.AAC.1
MGTVGASSATTVTPRKVEAAAASLSLSLSLVEAAFAAAKLCTPNLNSILTLPAVAVASAASRGTPAASANFWRIGVSTAGVKSETSPATVTATFTEYNVGGGAGGGEG